LDPQSKPQSKPESNPEAVDLLAYSHRWFVTSRFGGCSCHFRHWTANDLGPVEEWYSEDDDDVKASQFFFDLLMRILEKGRSLDIIDLLEDETISKIRSMDVHLNQVPRDHFRFLEGIRCELRL
jgi:hypothetical protein